MAKDFSNLGNYLPVAIVLLQKELGKLTQIQSLVTRTYVMKINFRCYKKIKRNY
jgi:hypothetical protein